MLLINEAIEAGSGVAKACIAAGIDRRTFRRWTATDGVAQVNADARPEAIRPVPSNRFSDEERACVLASCHEARFADVPPSQIVGCEVYESETGELAAQLFDPTVLAEGCRGQGVVLHADTGAAQRSSTLSAKLDVLGQRTSYSRPRVSNDNAYSEPLFRTTKYRHDFPKEGFKTNEDARVWVFGFVRWYNTEHRHSAIKFVTPEQRHNGHDAEILANRQRIYEQAKERNPHRWRGQIRNWKRPNVVWLNPVIKSEKPDEEFKEAA